MRRRSDNRQSGFTLLEVLISVLLITMAGTAMLVLHFSTFQMSSVAAKRLKAYQLGRQGLEGVKAMRKQAEAVGMNQPAPVYGQGWTTIANLGNGVYDLTYDSATGMYGLAADSGSGGRLSSEGTNFYRYVQVTGADGLFGVGAGGTLAKQIAVRVCWDKEAINLAACQGASAKVRNYLETKTYLTKAQYP